MSIDTLKRKDGTYRPAAYRDIAHAVDCGHTEHLRRDGITVACRPFKTKGTNYRGDECEVKAVTVDFYGPHTANPEDRDTDSRDFILSGYADQYLEAIRYIFERLNGSLDTFWQPGDNIEVWANQAEREGTVLAAIGDQIILEYDMPGTTSQWGYNRRTGQYRHPAQPSSALRIVTTIGHEMVGGYTAVSYNRVPKKWLAAIRAAEMTDWVGMGQRSTVRIPFPEEVTT